MKNLTFIIALSLLSSSSPTLKGQMVTYSGPVTFTLEVSKNASGGGTDDGYNWNVSVNEKRLINATFYVTFTGGTSGMQGLSVFKLTSVEESIDFQNSVSNTGEDQKSSQPCYNDRLEFTHNATPGDTRKRSSTVVSSRINTGKPVIEGGQLMFRGDEYFLTMMGTLRMNITSEDYSEESYPCLDTLIPPKSVSNTTTIDFPVGIGTKMKLGNLNYLEGTNVVDNSVSHNCNQCIPGEMARMVHGDMDCSYITNITTSWSLTKNCEALDKVGNELDKRNDISNSQKNRIKNVLKRLSDPSVDPYVFFSSGADNVFSISTEEQADIILNNKKTYMEDLRKNFNKECESAKSIEELTNNIIRRDTWVVQFINRLNRDYLSEHRLSPGQVKIKDWIADQQRNPDSIYSEYADK